MNVKGYHVLSQKLFEESVVQQTNRFREEKGGGDLRQFQSLVTREQN